MRSIDHWRACAPVFAELDAFARQQRVFLLNVGVPNASRYSTSLLNKGSPPRQCGDAVLQDALVATLTGLERREPAASLATNWSDSAELLVELDAATNAGFVLLVKVDGLRENGKVYTVVLSHDRFDPNRCDAADLRHALTAVFATHKQVVARRANAILWRMNAFDRRAAEPATRSLLGEIRTALSALERADGKRADPGQSELAAFHAELVRTDAAFARFLAIDSPDEKRPLLKQFLSELRDFERESQAIVATAIAPK